MVSKRDHLVDTAVRVFLRDGFHAAGVDRIIAEAGVAKMTLYNHFRSKDELILAALRRRDEQFRHWLFRAVEGRASGARARLLALFDVLGEWHGSADFRGCLFLNAAAEFHDPECPAHAATAEHKRLVLAWLTGLAGRAGASDPRELAVRIALLADGATAHASISPGPGPARAAREAAAVLLDAALGPGGDEAVVSGSARA